MRLNWFSPLPPEETDIAHYTARLLPHLAQQADVTLWTAQSNWERALEVHAPVRSYEPHSMPWRDLNRADLTVYHLGNNPRFHVPIWQVSRRHPGLVVLHDPCMQEFFLSVYRDAWKDRPGYTAHMERYYGSAGFQAADDLWGNRGDPYDLSGQYPLTELAYDGALAVLVHTRATVQTLQPDSRRPFIVAPLAYPASAPARADGDTRFREPYRLVVFGFLGRNRGLDAVLDALAQFPPRDRFRLDVYGPLWDRAYVRHRITVLGLDRLVRLHGYTPPTDLDRVLARAHLAVNLRFPTMGESSGSQLRIWDHALPSLVTRTGWYATIAEEAVAFVRPGHEVEDIQRHLHAFLQDPRAFAVKGAHGRRVLEARHQPAAYIRAILDVAAAADHLGRDACGYDVAEATVAEMAAWAPPTVPDEAYARVAAAIHALVAG